jgi:hexosaminidase
MKKHGLKNPIDAFDYYVQQMVGFVNEHGKTAIAWEGVPLEKLDPKKLVIMMWTEGNGPEAKKCVKLGYRIINAPNHGFAGLHDVKNDYSQIGLPKFNYEMNLYSFGDSKANIGPDNPLMIGAQINDWESAWDYSVSGARVSVPARDANAWNAREQRPPYEDYKARFAHTNALLERVMQPVAVTNKLQDDFDQLKAIQLLRAHTMFVKPVTVTMSSPVEGTTIRYTLDGTAPTGNSTVYNAPFQIEKSTDLRVALFDAGGARVSIEQNLHYDRINYEKSLTTDKPVTASSHEGDAVPGYVNDGFAMKDIWRGWWGATPCPQWIKIDLEKPEMVNRVVVFPYWDGGRYYQYIVEVSTDDKQWTKVVDMSKNTARATPEGQESKFDPIQARYIKVTVLKNSANPGAHLVEVRAFGPDSN